MEEQTLELPIDVVKASPGFSFDIGGSIAKLVYRSKEDFENGQPKDKELAAAGKGIVRKKLIPSDKVDDLLDFIKENCDLTMAEDGETIMYTTGIGGNSQKMKIEEALNGKIKNLAEVECFVEATSLFLKTRTAKELFKPVNENALKAAMATVGTFKGFDEAKDPSSKFEVFVRDNIDDYDPEKDTQRFPCILVLGGSAIGLMKVNEDGSSSLVDVLTVGGRFFLGGVSFLTGITDFAEISKLILESDGKTVDNFASDIIDTSVKGDIYGALNSDWRVFPFGKGLSTERDQAKKGDLIHSILESVCDNLGIAAVNMALLENSPRVYFAGNLVNTPKAQEFITRAMHTKRYLQKTQVNFEFLQHGGVLGAIGAFIKAHEMQPAQHAVE